MNLLYTLVTKVWFNNTISVLSDQNTFTSTLPSGCCLRTQLSHRLWNFCETIFIHITYLFSSLIPNFYLHFISHGGRASQPTRSWLSMLGGAGPIHRQHLKRAVRISIGP